MEINNILEFKSFDEFYTYLLQAHTKIKECFVVVKKGKSQEGKLSYIDAVYVALCFGWIDSTCRNIGGKTVQRFSILHRKWKTGTGSFSKGKGINE